MHITKKLIKKFLYKAMNEKFKYDAFYRKHSYKIIDQDIIPKFQRIPCSSN